MNTIETHILELIGEDPSSPDVFLDTSAGMGPIRDSINDAIEEIVLLTGSYKRKYYLMCEDGQNFYRLRFTRDQMAWITDAWLVEHKRRLEQTDIHALNVFNTRWLYNSGTPRSYFPIGHSVIGLWPAPASNDLIIEFTMVMIPERYSEDTDRLKLRDSFQWATVHYAVSEYYASRGDAVQAQYYQGLYLEKLGIQSFYPKAQERPWKYRTFKEPWPKEVK